MLTQLKTPGAYIEEVSKFPPSVAQVETAIPVFIGFTEKATRKVEDDLLESLVRITSMLEYETLFGGAKKEKLELKDDAVKGLTLVAPDTEFLMPYAMQLYFANGGGPCYIISIGDYEDASPSGDITARIQTCLDAASKEDEITLIVFPDATKKLEEADFYSMYQYALIQANDLKDRFVIMDTYRGETETEIDVEGVPTIINTINEFRTAISGDKYGAAYFPHLKTILNPVFDEEALIIHTGTGYDYSSEIQALEVVLLDLFAALDDDNLEENRATILVEINKINETHDVPIDVVSIQNAIGSPALAIILNDLLDGNIDDDFLGAASGQKLEDLKGTTLYNEIQAVISATPIVLPPSAAMAGVYAKTDSTRGVWKAPANVGLNYVVGPTEKVNNAQQDGLNVDPDAGKSINVIRKFTGKGTLVWGARTLDGNSNEWRYVSVRRFFNMVEESVKKASERFVFDANNANTWVKVKGMIENFLNTQWKAGALAGAKPEEAYYVSVGLDETMSAQDILEGRMIIEIGMAAVRPAEFIILRFSHKLQES